MNYVILRANLPRGITVADALRAARARGFRLDLSRPTPRLEPVS